ncbi:MAG: hypothetical protein JXQ65_12555 [Candidatus Marinimicrobia bacterium]|nr:hypothetical protein [Candidatus Neomarinimicrobiota bacterium]
MKLSYDWDVDPIFRDNCIACHGNGKNSSASLDLTSYENLMKGDSDSGPVVVPKYPEQSLLIDKIASEFPIIGSRMPINLPPLSDEEIRIIDVWIYRGAKDN